MQKICHQSSCFLIVHEIQFWGVVLSSDIQTVGFCKSVSANFYFTNTITLKQTRSSSALCHEQWQNSLSLESIKLMFDAVFSLHVQCHTASVQRVHWLLPTAQRRADRVQHESRDEQARLHSLATAHPRQNHQVVRWNRHILSTFIKTFIAFEVLKVILVKAKNVL